MVQLVLPFTRGGVSCLTPQQVENIFATADPTFANGGAYLSYSVFDAHTAAKACAKVGYAPFCGYRDTKRFKTIMTVRQAWVGAHAAGPISENAVVGECEAGRVTLDMKALVKAVEDFKPAYCMPLYAPNPLEEQPVTKKHRTAIARTSKWHTAAAANEKLKTVAAVPSSVVLAEAASMSASAVVAQSPMVFLDTVGQGETLGARTGAMVDMVRCAHSLSVEDASSASSTLVTSGSHHADAAKRPSTFVIAESIPALLLAALAGVDLVECEYGTSAARRGQAIDLTAIINVLTEDKPIEAAAADDENVFVLDLNDQKYQLDTTPFSSACPCYTCRRHTKAYLYHLLSVQEMNAETLLAIHNTSQVVRLCAALKDLAGMNYATERIQRALSLLAPE